jgi:HAE1 family hydrophobic/amphiphilic exporter-1
VFTGFFFALIAVAGILSAPALKVQRIPDVIIPAVGISASYPGASPAEMEKLVVKPIEEQLDGMENLERLSATVQNGTATILAQFVLDSDVRNEVVDVQRRVDTARVFMPQDLTPPRVYNDTSRTVLLVAVSSPTVPRARLEEIVTSEVVPKLRSLPGADIEEHSYLQREFHVAADVTRLQAHNATAGDVLTAIIANNANQPGGYFDSPAEELNVRLAGNLTSAQDIAEIPLSAPSGSSPSFRVGDVATVVDGFADRRRQLLLDGAPAIELFIGRTRDGDTLKITDGARDILASFAATFPDLRFQEISTSSDVTRASVNNVVRSLIESVIVTAIAMLIFLRSWRDGFIVTLAIPASVLATLLVMRLLSLTVDLVSMMALGLTIGILVDDSIVVLESIVRHRRSGESPAAAALNGRNEIAKAAIAITTVDVVVFAPIVLIGGEIGKYVHEFGIVVVVATLFSLLVSFTLTPLLAACWPASAETARKPARSALRRFERAYAERILPWAFDNKAVIAVTCAGAVLAAGGLLVNGSIQQEFIPFAPVPTIHGSIRYPVGTPIRAVEGALARVQHRIASIPGVAAVETDAGAIPGSEVDAVRGNIGGFTIVLARGTQDRAAVTKEAKKLAALAPGAQYVIGGGGDDHQISFALAGPDADLERAVGTLSELLRAQPAVADVRNSMLADAPQLDVAVDQKKARVFGVSPQDALLAARIATGGALATRVRMPSSLVDVRVELPLSERNAETLRRVAVRSAGGTLVPLGAVATIARGAAATTISRLARERVVDVTANLAPNAAVSLGTVVAPVLRAIERPGVLPASVHVIPQGEVDLFTRVLRDMRGAMVAAVLLVFMLMVILYGSVREPLVILTSLPLALVGALGGLALRHQTLNLFSMMALLMLFGLVAKNAILLVDKAKENLRRGLSPRAAMKAAASVRLRPILMTTCAMIVAMLPLSLGWGVGLADRSPMGTVLIGGLLSSLVLTLVLVPIVYVWTLESRTRADVGANDPIVRVERAPAVTMTALGKLPRQATEEPRIWKS